MQRPLNRKKDVSLWGEKKPKFKANGRKSYLWKPSLPRRNRQSSSFIRELLISERSAQSRTGNTGLLRQSGPEGSPDAVGLQLCTGPADTVLGRGAFGGAAGEGGGGGGAEGGGR